MNRRKFVKNVATGLFVPSLMLARKSSAASGMIVNPYFGISPTTQNWLTRIAAAGGATPSAATIGVMNQMGNTLAAAGLASLMVYLVVYVPDNLIASITPYIKTAGNDSCVNHNFVTGDLTIDGLKGNGTSKYLDSGCDPLTCFPSDASAGQGCYISNIPSAESRCEGSAEGNFPNGQFSLFANFNGLLEPCAWTFASTPIGTLPSNTTAGYVFGSIIAGTMTAFFANSSNAHASIATHAAGGTRPGGTPYIFFAENSVGTIGLWTTKRLSASFLTLTLTAGQSSTFFTTLDNCRRGLGGGFV
jgi:hypothetical protein